MLFLDADIALFGDPMTAIRREADLEVQVDEQSLAASLNMTHLPDMCGGAFWLRSCERSLQFLDRVAYSFAHPPPGVERWDDQMSLNFALKDTENTLILNRWVDKAQTEQYGVNANASDDTGVQFSVRFVSPFEYLNGHIWTKEVDTHTKGYENAFSLRGKIAEETKFLPTLLHLNGVNGKADVIRDQVCELQCDFRG